MAVQYRLVCLTSLASILLNTPMLAFSSPLPTLNSTSHSSNNAVKVRAIPAVDPDGWITFDSVGMMLPVKLTDEPFPPSECITVECKQRMDYVSSSNGTPLPPGLGLSRRDHPRQGSRDIARRKAQVDFDDITGQPTYRLNDYDDDDEEEEDDKEEDNEGYEQNNDEDEDYEDDDEDDDNDREALAKRHLPLVRGTSVLGTPTFSRRSEGLLARLFRRLKKPSQKSTLSKLQRKKKNKASLKGTKKKSKTFKKLANKDKPRKKISNKGKGKLKLGGIDLMKGATILTTITWYTGIDLLNPYCDRKTKWTPTDDSMIIAVTEKWSLRPACGEFMEITTQDDKEPRSIIARVVDLCGGCIPEVPHADLSKTAFSKLYDLDVGRISGLKMRRVGAPKRWDNKLFGPKVL